ncbi:P44/Msp2 family outer membrane protein [Wolbachia endosymbiont of Litomosoides sigmodontis]|uniref:P44/Msp2 family outer membrane protein n=1 Tax=Wolbachia endosymbiont of Litomosoides sigmodontis TaxID=80850 RepID=UPI0015884663|nr:P44/Msp2 family outer membrane protein [Wolbachia endosymbiont of Litomosoides sigmodontis]QKX02744.1 P44/Msp2 family outer membrane protein [Wolbachia endosymbiont of Litomosoides sigmodontis]
MIKKIIFLNILLILYISFFSVYANESYSNDEQFMENLMFTGESICYKSRKCNEKEIISVKDKKLDFYISANSGKIYSDNSETLVNGIKAIGERASILIERRYGTIIKNIVADEIESIKKFDGEIDFQWLNSISLGYYAGENGRIDFETMYSKVNIKNSNFPPALDRSASIFSFLLNFYYNPSIQDIQFAPYIGLGIGPMIFRLKKINESPQNSMPLNVPWFAYQVRLGVDYSITTKIKTFFGYRYFSIPIPIADDISTHNIEMGLIFNF